MRKGYQTVQCYSKLRQHNNFNLIIARDAFKSVTVF